MPFQLRKCGEVSCNQDFLSTTLTGALFTFLLLPLKQPVSATDLHRSAVGEYHPSTAHPKVNSVVSILCSEFTFFVAKNILRHLGHKNMCYQNFFEWRNDCVKLQAHSDIKIPSCSSLCNLYSTGQKLWETLQFLKKFTWRWRKFWIQFQKCIDSR